MTTEESRPPEMSSADVAAMNAAMAPTDRSIWPAVMTNVIATPMIRTGAICVARLDRFASDRNTGLAMAKKTPISRVTAAMSKVGLLVRSNQPGDLSVNRTASSPLVLLDIRRPPGIRLRSV